MDPSTGTVLLDQVRRTVDTVCSLGRPCKTRRKVSSLMILLLAPESISIDKRVPFTRRVIIVGGVIGVDSSCALNRCATCSDRAVSALGTSPSSDNA
ncbi:hypothetical protein M514_09070 [Trichuris suis]|uniref:Uncharacterized protein n=1 Tax=Trichuris suis TaxID=68888 RepID=A0A085NRB1_9BILA|nr:hypothetical protein M514_09070 [Trichuris suis]